MIRSLPAKWRAAILVCAKCEKKLGKRGFGPDGKTRLSRLLRERSSGGRGRKADLGVASVGCLKLCPKHAVTLLNGARPRDWLIVKPGTPIEEIELRLGIAPEPAIAAAE